MKKTILFHLSILFVTGITSAQETEHPTKRTYTQGVSITLLGSSYLYSLGYYVELPLKEKLSIQLDGRIAGTAYDKEDWVLGPTLEQHILWGQKHKLKVGFTEGFIFHPNSMNNRFDHYMPWWERPDRFILLFSVNLGYRFQKRSDSRFSFGPDVNFWIHNAKENVANAPDPFVWGKRIGLSFGVEFRVRLGSK